MGTIYKYLAEETILEIDGLPLEINFDICFYLSVIFLKFIHFKPGCLES